MYVFDDFGTLMDVDAAAREAAAELKCRHSKTSGFLKQKAGWNDSSGIAGFIQ